LNELISCAGYAQAGEITTTGCAFWCAEVVRHAAYIPLAAHAADRGRAAVRHGKQIKDGAKTEPGEVTRALGRDARERGI
jgi:hypothetical protein